MAICFSKQQAIARSNCFIWDLYEIPERWRIFGKRVDQRVDMTLKSALRMVTRSLANPE